MTMEIRPASVVLSRAFPVILCFLVFFFLALSSGCGDDTPTDPSPTPSLSGTVTESAPNASVLIAGATVTLDGVNAGKTTTTNVAGVYSFEGLSDGTFTVRASKSGYEDNSLPVTLSGSQTGFVVPLRPVRRTVNETLSGAVRALEPICEGSGKPCARHSIGVHYDGTIDVTLTWTAQGGSVDLALELWRGNTRLELSDVSVGSEHVSSFAVAGSSHEVRVIYSNGTAIANYELAVRRPS